METPITAIIPCYNEEENIRAAIECVLWADEIIVIDSYSTDNTMNIVAEYPELKLIQRKFDNHAAQKNWAIPQAKNLWVFILDADERVNEDLKEEIISSAHNPQNNVAFWIPRTNYFFGKKLKHVWKGDGVIRLFRKDKCSYGVKNVHEEIEANGPVKRMKNALSHHTFKNADHYLEKTRRYAKSSALDYDPKTGQLGIYHFMIKPLFRFFKHYFIEAGFLDGKAGLMISSVMAWGVFLRYFYMWEKRRND